MPDLLAVIQSLSVLPLTPKVIITLIGGMVYALLLYSLWWMPQAKDAKSVSDPVVVSHAPVAPKISAMAPEPLEWDNHWGTTASSANGTIYLSALQIKAHNISGQEVWLKDAFVTSGKTGQVARMKVNAGADGWISPSELNVIPPGAIITLRVEFAPPQGLPAKEFMLEWGIITFTALYDDREYKKTFEEPETSKIFEAFGVKPLGPHVSKKHRAE